MKICITLWQFDNNTFLLAHLVKGHVSFFHRLSSVVHASLLPYMNIRISLQLFIFIIYFTRMKVSGELPLLCLNMSDQRLQDLIGLAESIPLPESPPPAKENLFLVSIY